MSRSKSLIDSCLSSEKIHVSLNRTSLRRTEKLHGELHINFIWTEGRLDNLYHIIILTVSIRLLPSIQKRKVMNCRSRSCLFSQRRSVAGIVVMSLLAVSLGSRKCSMSKKRFFSSRFRARSEYDCHVRFCLQATISIDCF